MSKIVRIDRYIGKHEQISQQPTVFSSQDAACPDPDGNRTLYVLGFGILGAIVTNSLVFIYFASYYASG